jgi:predicted HTH domain antitoxin
LDVLLEVEEVEWILYWKILFKPLSISPMETLTLTLPAESLIGVRIPPRELHAELRRRLATALFADGILSGASACRMAGMGKAEFQHLLGERGIPQPLEESDYEQDLANLAAWKAL